ncbi:hypothetical protein [Noviherbaspirillum pedocola]|uniref:Uncharacterized protein n=1 Tax=Noviherbaspirillum pedocola TaxID=2801341 RepID=A0A934SNX0_9BURK|nr:hypothetical protein [Noviherbaspirillum pedocola]MBK4734011.1 hypothetical protein [Noviherbaspirillum pedocola]
MNDYSLHLTIAYVALAFLLLILCLATRWRAWIKIGMIALVTASYFIAQSAFQGMLGWPAAKSPPEKFVLLAVVAEEPDKERGTRGALYVWVNAMQGTKPAAEPRAYRLPYARDLHALLGEAMKKNRQGISQIGTLEAPAGGKGGAWFRLAADPNVKIRISDAPAPQLPEK